MVRRVVLFLLMLTLISTAAARDDAEVHRVIVTGVKTRDGATTKPAFQQTPELCWAACAEAVLGHYHIERKQREIAIQCFGAPVSAPLDDPRRLILAFNICMDRQDGSTEISNGCYYRQANQVSFLRELLGDHPIVVLGTFENGERHAVVLIGAEYMIKGADGPRVSQVRYWDPEPVKGGVHSMGWDQFSRSVDFWFQVRGGVLPSARATRD